METVLIGQKTQAVCLKQTGSIWLRHMNPTTFETSHNKPQQRCANHSYSDRSRGGGLSGGAQPPFGPSLTRRDVINDCNARPCQQWFWGVRPSCCELHHPNNIILFMRLVDRSRVWLAWGSAQVNWKPELCNSTGSWADIVPLVITQEACVSVYRLRLGFTAPKWEWNIRGQVMDVSISSTEAAEMGRSYHWTHLIFSHRRFDIRQDADRKCLEQHSKYKPRGSPDAPWGDSISLFTFMFSCLTLGSQWTFYVRDAAEVEILLRFSV